MTQTEMAHAAMQANLMLLTQLFVGTCWMVLGAAIFLSWRQKAQKKLRRELMASRRRTTHR